MRDVIYRDDAIEAFPKITLADIGFATKAEYRAEAIENINALPSVEVVQGEWICKGDYAICSKCGGSSGTQFDGVERIPRITTYCPHCGVRMYKGGEE